jgi:glycosyltransferase involved in cell wall biosynthesis
LKIAHVTDCYLPRLGGIEMQVHDLAAHQLAMGHQVQVLTCTNGQTEAPGSESETDRPATLRLPAGLWNIPTAAGLRQLRQVLRPDRFDVVHVHSSVGSPFAWTAARVATRAGVPVVLTMHSLFPSGRLPLRASDLIAGWSRWPVEWSAVSEVAAAPLRLLLGDVVSVLPNGIDPQAWFTPQPREPSDEFTIVSVMRLAQRKRPQALLRTLAGIRALVGPEVRLRAVLIGEGKQRQRVERSLRRSGMDSWVTLTGRLDRAQIGPLLSAADVFLAPARQESFGIAALEARCAGLPVVAMASGGVGEFIRDGQEGFLVHSDDEMAWVTAELLNSPAQLRSMQEHNRLSTPDLAWPRVLALSEDLYRAAGATVPVPASATVPPPEQVLELPHEPALASAAPGHPS